MKRVVGVLGVVGVVMGISAAAALADVRGDRESAMKGMGGAMGNIGRLIRADTLDADAAKRSADQVAGTAKILVTLFPEGSQANSRAKPDVWSNRAAFTAVANDFSASADKLVAAVQAGDKAQIGAAMQAVGAGCNSCHNQFRTAQ